MPNPNAQTKSKRWKFAIGATVTVVGDRRFRPRVVKDRWVDRRGEVYWLDRPVCGLRYFNGGDLTRASK